MTTPTNTTTSRLDPHTMARVLSLLIEQRILADQRHTPQDNATNACLVAQLAYWQEREQEG